MFAILLCAGFATRLYPLTRDYPKHLLPVAGKPVIQQLKHGATQSLIIFPRSLPLGKVRIKIFIADKIYRMEIGKFDELIH
ncbi:MAG: hypothetical protein DRH90_01450 [Deltaproteobacteria bacterium]|nr:MAG: hypothetical protein DRH90_01450 [Deltaproteobacteria bacterium]RLC16491.1 MAG: hypothetical protein DRI24_08230 [Deltaproteobacteria bacterium]HHE73501.1 hypothetical protein [Desulfobacteraceae bacterium]